MVRSMSCISILLAFFLSLLSIATAAQAAPRSSERAAACHPAGLADARVRTWIRLEHGGRTYTKVLSELTVEVPGNWPLTQDLLLSEESSRYILAMSCLTRTTPGQQRNWSEYRQGPPAVTSVKGGGVKVVDRTHTWVNTADQPITVGAWQIRAGVGRWTAKLMPPAALVGAHWTEVKVDPGKPGAEAASPAPDAGEGGTALLWYPDAAKVKAQAKAKAAAEAKARAEKPSGGTNPGGGAGTGETATTPVPAVAVSLDPAWQRSWAAQGNTSVSNALNRMGTFLTAAVTVVLMLHAAVLYRRRPTAPTAEQDATLRNLAAWAVGLAGVVLLTQGRSVLERLLELHQAVVWPDERALRDHAFALAAVAVLFSVARPSRRVWAAVGVLALPPALVALRPSWFGLGRDTLFEWSGLALAAQGCASACLFMLFSLAFAAVLWRLARDGGLLPASRVSPGSARRFRLRVAGPAVLAWTVLVAVWYVLTEERTWQRVSWLSDRSVPDYGADHENDFLWDAVGSVSSGQEWLSWTTWMLTGVAALAVLRTWQSETDVSPLDQRADRLLFLTFFAVVVPLGGGGTYVGSALFTVLWIPLGMLCLYAFVAPFAGRSALAQPLEPSGLPLATAVGPTARAAFLERARSYREIHAELRRLDQGMFGDEPPKRSDLEQRLNELHEWPAPGGQERLPARVSVVDAALALGPRDTWWANGSRCARLALIPAVPASLLMMWVWRVRGEAGESTLGDPYGFLSLGIDFVGWMATWAGAAFVMGALWRLLPGQRGAAKALPLTLAFAVPIAADVLVLQFTDESTAGLALAVSAMLFVLTVTGIAVDFDTFRGERRYWQSRLGLLLSVYQMRYYSLQLAYLVAQLVAMISIWQFIAEPAAAPEPVDPK
ncbi:DUF6185 family protein [Streptomyces sp. NPDC059491]|uniref:DUF6185 family protein n=1 Tax=Streptomyces sp. NPDC059491 TaxID=3346850 RepID=UPI0036ABBE0D